MILKKYVKTCLSAVTAAAVMLTQFAAVPAVYADSAGFDNFKGKDQYSEVQFSDVPSDAWYAESVKAVYEKGLIKGTSEDTFSPSGSVTLAETVALAARLHSIYYTGSADFQQTQPWYKVYVDYAEKNGIIHSEGVDFTQKAKRTDFAAILAIALPESAYPAINNIKTIPDVSETVSVYGEEIFQLYNAGVLTGSDKYGTYGPDKNIERSAAAAIIARIADPSLRKTFTLQEKPFTPVPLNKLNNYKSLKKKMTDAQFKQAYDEAVKLVKPYANMSREDQLYGIAYSIRERFENGMSYSMESAHYNDPYGFFIEGSASCAGCTRATGLCLNILGIPYEHVNENKYLHQWCRVKVGSSYYICDAYGLYCGQEPAAYKHPYF